MKRLLMIPLALLAGSCVAVVEDWGEEARYSTFESGEKVQSESQMQANIELPVGSLEIQPGSPGDAYQMSVYYNEAALTPKLDFRREGDTARLKFELEGRWASRGDKTRAHFKLNPEKPLQLEAHTGVGESEIDLSGMNIADMRLETGVGQTNLSMLEPNRGACRRLEVRSGVGALEVKGLGNFGFDRMLFEGGVGAAELDFSGSWERVGDVEIRVGVGGIEIRIPRSLGAEIRSSKSFLSGIDLTDFRKEGDTYYSNNLDRVQKVVRIKINAGIGGVNIRWI